MDYKEKYEMALEGIQEILGSGEDSIKMSRLQLRLQGIFPELKESEDERIRKAIHIYLDWLDGRKDYSPRGEYTIRDMIAWVEKQGEHANFRNKIQIGDKVTRNEDGVLVNLSQLKRIAKPAENKGKHGMGISEATKQKLEDNLNKALEKETAESWNRFLDEQKPAWSEEDEEIYKKVETAINSYYAPFSRDAEEMSEWFKNLKDRVQPKQEVLEKLEEWLDEYVSDLADVDTASLICSFTNYLDGKLPKSLRPQPKQEWSKEDENNILFLTSIIEECFKDKEKITLYGDTACANFTKENVIDRLKSLKSRIGCEVNCTTTKEWSEDDENRINRLIAYFEDKESFTAEDDVVYANWLKSLKERYTWKPTKEQLTELRCVISGCSYDIEPLVELEKELKAL